MSSFRQLMMKAKGGEQLETMYLRVQGSPTIVNGIAYNFNDTSYLYMYQQSLNKPFELKIKFKIFSASRPWTMYCFTGTDEYSGVMAIGCFKDGNTGITHIRMFLSTNNSSWNIAEEKLGTYEISMNTWYYFKLIFDGSHYITQVSTDDVNYTTDLNVSSSSFINNGYPFNICFGKARTSAGWYIDGQIDVNKSRFTFDGTKYKFEIQES